MTDIIQVLNNSLDTLFNSHIISFYNGSTILISIDCGYIIAYGLLVSLCIWFSFLGFQIISRLFSIFGGYKK